MAETILDRDVLAGIGSPVLVANGIDAEVLKQWRRRGIPWKERTVVRDLAKESGVQLPSDFERVQRPAPQFAKLKRKSKAKKRTRAS